MRRTTLFLVFCVFGLRPELSAQHEHAETPKSKSADVTQKDTMDMDKDHSQMGHMSHAYSLHLPMERNGSGTGWLPDASPVYGKMIHSPKWSFMLHGNVFLRYNSQDFTEKGIRGDEKFDIPSWFMLMGQRKISKNGLFHFNTMFSLDPILIGEEGYPLLFQTGETYQGELLIDRQHPHDLIAELSVSYAHALSNNTDLFAYLAYPGEPALGPVAFMHRVSSLDNPNAPLSHHWVDATHITYGVATLGLRMGIIKLESSLFTGREPDENRYDLDEARFDSWSLRLSANPAANWSFQTSYGFIKSPEAIHPAEDVRKASVSAHYAIECIRGNLLNATALWGRNINEDHPDENAFLVESSYRMDRWVIYGRYDYTQKSREDLLLNVDEFGENTLFNIHAFTAGLNFDIFRGSSLSAAPGLQFTVYTADEKLHGLYGKNPLGLQVYLRIYPTEIN